MAHHRRVPKWTAAGRWHGGDTRTLYSVRDRRTGQLHVRPGGKDAWKGVGPEVDINIATRAEAEQHWQSPLSKGWKVRGEYAIGSESPRYKQLLLRVTARPKFSNFEADSLVMAIGRAFKHGQIDDEERELLAAFVEARR